MRISEESNLIRKKSNELERIIFNIHCYLELECEKGLVFVKMNTFRKRMSALQSADEHLRSMSGNKDLSESQIESIQNDIELMELITNLYKNAVRKNDACKTYLEIVCSVCHWVLKECRSQNILLPKGYKLSQMIKDEGFELEYPKPTDLLHGEEPTFDVTECVDLVAKMILFYFESSSFT